MTEGSNQIWYDLITFCLMLIGFVLLEKILANTLDYSDKQKYSVSVV